ncbi:hypothetical protein C5167_041148 [Papaver somniferum]|uniref:Uncharacterized protein n=1 Tax=Papaver somniferum TaxID=3469 RepID=A0A4Y7IL59_PAPSO|nr:hypothetical protein C5167_041148 [Papaver somniferum]
MMFIFLNQGFLPVIMTYSLKITLQGSGFKSTRRPPTKSSFRKSGSEAPGFSQVETIMSSRVDTITTSTSKGQLQLRNILKEIARFNCQEVK